MVFCIFWGGNAAHIYKASIWSTKCNPNGAFSRASCAPAESLIFLKIMKTHEFPGNLQKMKKFHGVLWFSGFGLQFHWFGIGFYKGWCKVRKWWFLCRNRRARVGFTLIYGISSSFQLFMYFYEDFTENTPPNLWFSQGFTRWLSNNRKIYQTTARI